MSNHLQEKRKLHQCHICLEDGKDTAFTRRPDLKRHVDCVHKKEK